MSQLALLAPSTEAGPSLGVAPCLYFPLSGPRKASMWELCARMASVLKGREDREAAGPPSRGGPPPSFR